MGLRQKTVSGFIWTSAGALGNGVISFLVTMILARTLLPYDFAIVELLVIFITLSNVVVNSGFSQAIIRDENPSEKDLSSVFYFSLLLSLLIYTLLFFSSQTISNYFATPELALLSKIVFLVIIFNSFTIIPNATLNRELQFAKVSKSAVTGSFMAGAISVTMALTGFGVWALVANMVLMPFFRSILLWKHSKWRPVLQFSFKSVKKYLNFGFFLMIQGIMDAIVSNIVSLFIGKNYTKNDLGYFSQGRKFDGYIVTPISSIIERTTYPILSKIKNEQDRLKTGYRQIIGVIMFVFIPIMFFVMATSENMIATFFGEKWRVSGEYLRVFAIGGLFYPLQKICVNIVYVKGKTKTMLYFSLIKQAIRLASMLAVLKMGVVMLAYSFVISGIIGSMLFIYLGMKYINYSLKELIIDLHQIVLTAIVPILAVLVIGHTLHNWNVVALFLLQSVVMFLLYIGINLLLKNKHFTEVISIQKDMWNKVLKR